MSDTNFKQWGGGYQPKETIGKLVECRFRDGFNAVISGESKLCWEHTGSSADIVAYRVLGEKKNTTALDKQVGGEHYKGKAIQPVEYIHQNGLGFLSGNVVKYISRHKDKGGAADVRKAIHYCELILELEYEDGKAD